MNNSVNEIKLSTDVVTSIAEIAITEIDNVYLPKLFNGKKLFKNTSIQTILDKDKVELTISIIIEYGVTIPEIAPVIQETVKENIEIMTGLKVSKINLTIEGILANSLTKK